MTARTIDIAGLRLRFRGDAAAAALIDERYGAFSCPAVADAVDVDLDLRPVNTLAAPVDQPLEVVVREGRIVFEGPSLAAEISADRASARVRAPLADRAVDVVVRVLLAEHLLARGGLLVHASAVRIGSAAWVFAGPSGSGKSTLGAELDGDLLSDEAVALLPRGDGVVAFATPYWTARPELAPVAGLVFPSRADGEPRWEYLSPAQAAARLLPEVGPLPPESTPRALRVVADLVRRIPCARVTLSSIPQIRRWLQPRLTEGAPV